MPVLFKKASSSPSAVLVSTRHRERSQSRLSSKMQRVLRKCLGIFIGCMKLEHFCIYFAVINLVFKTLLVFLGVASSDSTIVSLVSLGPPYHQDSFAKDYTYNSRFIWFMRAVLIADSVFSIFYSLVLIVGVRKNSIRLLKSCFVYGTVILFLSSAASIPRFFEMFFVGDYNYFGRRVEAFVLTMVCAVQVLVVHKTYQKFRKMEDLQQLIQKQSEQRKKEEEFTIVDTAL